MASITFLMNPYNNLCLAITLGLSTLVSAESALEKDFLNPPTTARPYVWWHWMGSNFSKEGITKDLEAMKAAGIGGATIFNLASAVQESQKPTLNNPWPDQTYRSPKYWEALRHAAAEAQRLGLEIGLHNTVGYSTTGGPWIDEEKNMQKVVSQSVTVEGGKHVSIEIPRPDPTTYGGYGNSGRHFTFFRDIAVLAVPAEGDVDPAKAIDLTKQFKDNHLDWDAPAGKWQIVRLAHAPTGACPHPVPDDLIGKTLEVDKISLDANRYHWDQVIDPLKQHLGPYLGKSFHHFLIDSYEAGKQNWTPAFREEFTKRLGYDPLPWLLTLEKRTVGSADLSARFTRDYDELIHTLYYENGWLTGVKKIKSVGMDLQFEPYGGPFDTVEGAALADIPMGEFWTGKGGGINPSVVAAARAAGRTVVGAEAFTGPPDISKWSETPAFLKRSADGTYASGANRLVLHHWVHQPFDDRYKPGMGMGWWGTHFNRHQTWARDGKAFFQYLGRTQALLQAGETPSDFVSVGKSQGSDVISWREFRTGVKVRDGRIVLSSGRSYPFLSIPHDGRLSPDDVRRITSLLGQGAVIVCSKPNGAPGLSGYPQSDAAVKASTLWNNEAVRTVGKGKLYTSGDTAAAIRDFKITPMIQFPGASGIAGTARQTKDETLFFVANTTAKTTPFTASFRVSGMRPELWNAEDGSIRFAPVWRAKDGRTEVDLTLDTYRSIFVVFRDSKLPADHVVALVSQPAVAAGKPLNPGTPTPASDLVLTAATDGAVTASSSSATRTELVFASGKRRPLALTEPAAAVTLAGPWTVVLDSPVDAKQSLPLPELINLADHSASAVKYFSGTATYSRKFEISNLNSPVHLDLGQVHDLARVAVNGKDLGVLWQAPFTLDITAALKPGENLLEIAVTNTWHNRLVGDEQFPADFEWGEDRGSKGHALKTYPEWFVKNQPRPEQGRKCFVVWYYHRKDTKLLPAGLLGPVTLVSESVSTVKP